MNPEKLDARLREPKDAELGAFLDELVVLAGYPDIMDSISYRHSHPIKNYMNGKQIASSE